MSAMQAEDVRASFLYTADPNGHHQEWLGSTTTRTVVVLLLWILQRLLVGYCGGILDFLITDVSEIVRMTLVSPLGNSVYLSLSTAISMTQVVPNL